MSTRKLFILALITPSHTHITEITLLCGIPDFFLSMLYTGTDTTVNVQCISPDACMSSNKLNTTHTDTHVGSTHTYTLISACRIH